MSKKPLYQLLLEAGVPQSQLDHHATDLYVLDTPKNRKIIEDYYSSAGKSMDVCAPTFRSTEDPPRRWFDCAFEYIPAWGAFLNGSQ